MYNKQKHVNIPIFLPEIACPNKCIYCHQPSITGIKKLPDITSILHTIDTHIQTINYDNTTVEIAFFGGNFTGIPIVLQEDILSAVQPYIHQKKASSIRISTRPDYISEPVLSLLKKYPVKTIELGVQSMDDTVLKKTGRGYLSDTVIKASEMILKSGFTLGHQMMLGLPGDSLQSAMETTEKIIHCQPAMVRVYPLLVLKNTPLETMYINGAYKPLSLSEAVAEAKEVFKLFFKNNIPVIKMGLHPSRELTSGHTVVAGPFHPSFAELVYTALWKEKLHPLTQKPAENLTIYVHPHEINHAIGFKSENKLLLLQALKKIEFKTDSRLSLFSFHAVYS